jgi:hypothetical protein
VVGGQLAAEELGLAGDAKSGAFLGVLSTRSKLAHLLLMRQHNRVLPPGPELKHQGRPALKANSSNPTVKPGRGSYRVPAFATMARRVVGPPSSREATLTPVMSVGSYEATGDATAANPRCASFAAPWRRRASWLPLVRAGLQIMVGGAVCRQLTLLSCLRQHSA